jgi:uncharacterized protein (TIGR03000 family)
MCRRWLLRGAMMFIAASVLLTPAPASAQVIIRPGGFGIGGFGGIGGFSGFGGFSGLGYGGYGGYFRSPYSPISPAFNPAGFGGYTYGNPLFPSYVPTTYGTNPFVTGGYGYPGLYGYGQGYNPSYETSIATPSWLVGPSPGYAGTGAPRMRQGSTVYPAMPAVGGGQLVGSLPSTALPTEPAVIDVKLPDPDAEVWVEGSRTTQTGIDRRYVSPALSPGSDYVYAIRARWRDERGAIQVQQQNVVVQAGARVNVVFPTAP